MNLVLPHLYQARSYQRAVFEAWRAGYRRFLTVWPRKAGKDITWWNFLIVRAVELPAMYWYVLPTVEQAKKVIWYGFSKTTAVDDEGEPVAGTRFLEHLPRALLEREPNNSDYLLTLRNGSLIQLIGSDKLESIVGPNPQGVVFSEYAIQYPNAWEQVVSPILTQNGGWAAFQSTPRGRNHLYKLWEGAERNVERWFYDLRTIETCRRDAVDEDGSPIVSLEEIERLRAEGQEESLLQQEYFCSWTGDYQGSYYARALGQLRAAGGVREIRWNPSAPVFTVWDLGVGDANAIWFAQVVANEVRLIDYYENSGQGMGHYIREVLNRPYVYSTHWAPHDIEHREYSSGQSRKEAAANLGVYFRVVPKLGLDEGIDAARRLLPRCYFDRVRCDGGLRCLENYARQQKPDGSFQNFPRHDKWSHGADAFRYLALIVDRETGGYVRPLEKAECDFDVFRA